MGDEPSNSNVPFLLNDDIWQYVNDLVCSTSIIEEQYFESEIQLFPNPANEQLTVSVRAGVLGSVVLYNQFGVKIKEVTSGNSSFTVEISNLENGVYLISLPDLGKTMRFVKEN